MKVIITGDRWWDDIETVVEALQDLPAGTLVIHGGARGADTVAGEVAKALGFDVKVYPYMKECGRGGGPARNRWMAKENTDADFLFVFHDDLLTRSKGTKDMALIVAPKYLPDTEVRFFRSKKVVT